jgi:hypothetical protein
MVLLHEIKHHGPLPRVREEQPVHSDNLRVGLRRAITTFVLVCHSRFRIASYPYKLPQTIWFQYGLSIKDSAEAT